MKFYDGFDLKDSLYGYDNHLNSSVCGANKRKYLARDSDLSFARIGLLNSCRNSGLNYILNKLISSDSNNSKQDDQKNGDIIQEDEARYYISWKLGLWDDDSSDKMIRFNSSQELANNFNQNLYESMNSFIHDETSFFKHQTNNHKFSISINLLAKTKEHLLKELTCTKVNLNSITNQTYLTRLYYLEQIKRTLIITNNKNSDHLIDNLINNNSRLSQQYESKFFSTQNKSFDLFDDLSSIRLSLFKSFIISKPSFTENLKRYICNLYDSMIDLSIIHKNYPVSFDYFFSRLKKVFIRILFSRFVNLILMKCASIQITKLNVT